MMFYKSETYNMSSTPKHGKVYGTHNVVEIKNGKGKKIKEAYNASGAVIERKSVLLKPEEIKKITAGTFVGGLWRNCSLKNCKRRTSSHAATRKKRRVRNTQ
jgi:hypothetical protein